MLAGALARPTCPGPLTWTCGASAFSAKVQLIFRNSACVAFIKLSMSAQEGAVHEHEAELSGRWRNNTGGVATLASVAG